MRLTNMNFKELYTYAYDFLLSQDGVTDKLIKKHLVSEHQKPRNINTIYKQLCASAQNRQMSSKVIGQSIGGIENLKSVLKDIKIVKLDLSNYAIKDELVEICKDADFIFHFAALADIVPSIEMPLRYHKANVDGTINILEAARKSKKLKKFLYAASSSCYGIPNIYPTPETAPIKPQYPYALTKYLGEEYVLHWGKIYKIPVISLRLFNVFGPRHRTSGTYGAVFGVFLTQLLHNKPLTIVGDGEQTRDFTFVTDVAEAFWLAANSDVEVEIFNVGSGGTYSINYLVKLLGSWENRVYIPKRPGEPDCTFADIAKIKKY